jgi:hypothetical protein
VEAPLNLSNPCVAAVLRSLDARGRFAFSFVTTMARPRSTSCDHIEAAGVRGDGGWADGSGSGGLRMVMEQHEQGGLRSREHAMHGGLGGKRGVLALL